MAEVTKARTGHLIRKLFGILQARPDGRQSHRRDDSARRLPLKPA